jgi:hypothetical protein
MEEALQMGPRGYGKSLYLSLNFAVSLKLHLKIRSNLRKKEKLNLYTRHNKT